MGQAIQSYSICLFVSAWKYWTVLGCWNALKVVSAFIAMHVWVPLVQLEVCGLMMAGSVLFLGKGEKKNLHCQFYSECTWRRSTHGHVRSLYCLWYATSCNAILLYTCDILCGFLSFLFLTTTFSLGLILWNEGGKKKNYGRQSAMLLLSFAVNLRVLFGCIFLIYKHALK